MNLKTKFRKNIKTRELHKNLLNLFISNNFIKLNFLYPYLLFYTAGIQKSLSLLIYHFYTSRQQLQQHIQIVFFFRHINVVTAQIYKPEVDFDAHGPSKQPKVPIKKKYIIFLF